MTKPMNRVRMRPDEEFPADRCEEKDEQRDDRCAEGDRRRSPLTALRLQELRALRLQVERGLDHCALDPRLRNDAPLDRRRERVDAGNRKSLGGRWNVFGTARVVSRVGI